MKTSLAILCVLATLCYAPNLQAQQCTDVPDFEYPYDGQLSLQGFVPSDQITCVPQAQNLEVLIPFLAYSTIPNGQSVDSLQSFKINSISNLPCGLCWALNKGNKTYEPGESGLLLIKGFTSSAIGQYILNIDVTITLITGTTLNTTIEAIAGSLGKVVLRVVDSDGSVVPVNYGIQGNISSPCN